MLIFYGLGNNEEKYLRTKHNAGRIVLQNLVNKKNLQFEKQNGFFLTKNEENQQKVFFLYSSGFMNESGQPLASLLSYFKIDCTEKNFKLIILQDDSDQFIGRQKLTVGGGSAGHRGIDSIYRHTLNFNLQLENIWRLKIGIRPENNRLKSEVFVLNQISPAENAWYETIAQMCYQNFPYFLEQNLSRLQNQFNTLTLKNEFN